MPPTDFFYPEVKPGQELVQLYAYQFSRLQSLSEEMGWPSVSLVQPDLQEIDSYLLINPLQLQELLQSDFSTEEIPAYALQRRLKRLYRESQPEPPLPNCPCGCGIKVLGDTWMNAHYDDLLLCHLCGRPATSSGIGKQVTVRNGSTMSCPLCAYFVAMSQVDVHAERLVKERQERRKADGTVQAV